MMSRRAIVATHEMGTTELASILLYFCAVALARDTDHKNDPLAGTWGRIFEQDASENDKLGHQKTVRGTGQMEGGLTRRKTRRMQCTENMLRPVSKPFCMPHPTSRPSPRSCCAFHRRPTRRSIG